MITKFQLPIDSIKEKIISSIESFSNIILKASPGSGKTTRVPLYLLEKTNKKIFILEPRRLAAKLAAIQVAKELGETVGKRVGYIFRYEKVVSSQTRIFFLTEGTFLKILSNNSLLDDVSIIILDEFHERHLSTDAALTFVTKLQKSNRPDLKIIVMSATIETEKLHTFLNNSASTTTIELSADRFALKTQFLPNVTSIIQATLARKVYSTLQDILEQKIQGDILIFLPGMKEIKECQLILEVLCAENEIDCYILHGDLDSNDQDEVLKISIYRKIILSTNIAESSVTIPGIKIVIDSGLQRESSYNFFSGLPELKITKICRASATQRAGRANRLSPGFCYRLYAELDFEQRSFHQKPEIEKSDLSEHYLNALNLFNTSLEELSWYEAPPLQSLKNSRDLLYSLNATDEFSAITLIGKKILQYSLHPRLGRILVEAEQVPEKLFREILLFLSDFLNEKNKDRFIKSLSRKSPFTLSATKRTLEEIILNGYPDRVARARGGNFFDVITKNGDTLKIAPQISQTFDPNHPLWIVLELNNKGEVLKLIPIEEEWLYDLTPFPIIEETRYFWDEKNEHVFSTERIMIGKILLSESRIQPKKANAETTKILIEVANSFVKKLETTQEYERLLTLNIFLKNLMKPLFDIEIMKKDFSNQLHFRNEDKEALTQYFYSSLKDLIDPKSIFNLDLDFPLTIQLADKRKIAIQYDHTQDPFIESFIQDFYGLNKTPVLAKGQKPITLKLLGPHKRALQVTQDLPGFWRTTYPQMFKELTREYPRHHWPLNPEKAPPILLKRQLPTDPKADS